MPVGVQSAISHTNFVQSGFTFPRNEIRWVDVDGIPCSKRPSLSAENVISEQATPHMDSISFRDPNSFKAGELHEHIPEWEKILRHSPQKTTVLNWITNGVNIHDFLKHFHGDFQGEKFDHDYPPSRVLPNAAICQKFHDFIDSEIKERLSTGAIMLWGEVDKVPPPHIVSPLTVEPTKPRLCMNLMYLNCWMRDTPFSLDTLLEVPRLVQPDSFLTKLDDKSGYDHIRLHPSCTHLVGFQWGGSYFVACTLPFGFKNSAYVYHTTNLQAISYLRQLRIACLLYIDDRLMERFTGRLNNPELNTSYGRALIAVYCVAQVTIRLGYFIGLKKSQLVPVRGLEFLGAFINAPIQSFMLPERKRLSFTLLREHILSQTNISLKTLQRFVGKCISLALMVPAAKLYTAEAIMALSRYARTNSRIPLSGRLREEISHWQFVDSWTAGYSWLSERHNVISLATDASSFKWGASVSIQGEIREFGDYFSKDIMTSPILVKEAYALLHCLEAVHENVRDSRVDAKIDNQALIASWAGQGSRSHELNDILKNLFQVCFKGNILLTMTYIPSAENPADKPSRHLSKVDATLSARSWELIQQRFGGREGHTLDLMALDSNAMVDRHGNTVPHFTPYPTPFSSGINIFAQKISNKENCYVFPPFILVSAVVSFIRQEGLTCSLVFPLTFPIPAYFPVVTMHAVEIVALGGCGEKGIVEYPSKTGFTPDKKGLPCPLLVARFDHNYRGKSNSQEFDVSALSTAPQPAICVVGDSIVRFLKFPPWAGAVGAHIHSLGGGKLTDITRKILEVCPSLRPHVLVVHAGTNNINKLSAKENHIMAECRAQLNHLVDSLVKLLERQAFAVVISSVIPTTCPLLNVRVKTVNEWWQEHCKKLGWRFIEHQVAPQDLRDSVHPNRQGCDKMLHSLRHFVH